MFREMFTNRWEKRVYRVSEKWPPKIIRSWSFRDSERKVLRCFSLRSIVVEIFSSWRQPILRARTKGREIRLYIYVDASHRELQYKKCGSTWRGRFESGLMIHEFIGLNSRAHIANVAKISRSSLYLNLRKILRRLFKSPIFIRIVFKIVRASSETMWKQNWKNRLQSLQRPNATQFLDFSSSEAQNSHTKFLYFNKEKKTCCVSTACKL